MSRDGSIRPAPPFGLSLSKPQSVRADPSTSSGRPFDRLRANGRGTPNAGASFITPSRRDLLALGFVGGIGVVWMRPASAQTPVAPGLQIALRAYAGDAPIRPGKVQFEIAPLVENGNTVPIRVAVESPMTAADHVAEIAIFNERNPQRDVARFRLGPRSGRAEVSTRIRLATSQQLVALARMSDGSVWSHTVDVIVTLAACIE